ncbi:MAG: hypothetical protein HY821_21015 [Acidobacteria bacterium]|nr:hypothetical protein [Acidobacteriota bacterium]
MRKLFYTLILAVTLVALMGPESRLSAQQPAQGQGTNYEPPSSISPESHVETAPPPPPEEPNPLLQLPPIDWGSQETWVKLALLVGSVLLARRAFTDMTD